MQVHYIKDFEYDTFMIWMMLGSDDPSGVENRAKSMGVSSDDLSKISCAKDYKDIKDFLETLAKRKYQECEGQIDNIIPKYQAEWDKINNKFSSEIEKLTGRKWNHDIYDVVVSPFHPGISTNGGDTVVRSAFEDPKGQTRITAHEILMSHIWNILFDKFPESKNDSLMHYWGFNEITTVAILGLEPNINILWRERERGYDNYLRNYSQLKPLMNLLKDLYLNKKDFSEYLNKSVEILNSGEYKNKNLLYQN